MVIIINNQWFWIDIFWWSNCVCDRLITDIYCQKTKNANYSCTLTTDWRKKKPLNHMCGYYLRLWLLLWSIVRLVFLRNTTIKSADDQFFIFWLWSNRKHTKKKKWYDLKISQSTNYVNKQKKQRENLCIWFIHWFVWLQPIDNRSEQLTTHTHTQNWFFLWILISNRKRLLSLLWWSIIKQQRRSKKKNRKSKIQSLW